MCFLETASAQTPARDLTEISLEDLLHMEVTSVSKKGEKLFQTPAAVYVITPEDIRRSGATNIPDLLRMAPGVEVAQVDENAWAISIRGFRTQYANKVLVLIDGRTVYDPLFSGVLWDQQDVPLEDIDRIEVIRGPGGTVWGANAVNGVINIITKNAKATPGELLTARGGSGESAEGLVQYGGKIADKGAYRIFGKAFNVGNSLYQDGVPGFTNGGNAAGGWHLGHGGFRADLDVTPRDAVTVQGDFLRTIESQTLTSVALNPVAPQRIFNNPISVTGGNLVGSWTRTLQNGSDMSLRFYVSHSSRLQLGAGEDINDFNLDFQHHLLLASRHDVVWGLG